MPKLLVMPSGPSGKPGSANIGLGKHPLTGEWINGFRAEDDIKVTITGTADDFKIKVVSKQDGEEAKVYEPEWNGEVLSFNIYWDSIGRFIKCRIQILDDKRIAYTYTHTATEYWHRAG